MKVKVTERYEAVVIEIKGNFMGDSESTEFSEKLKQLLAEGKKKIVVDLGDVKFMNSSGLGFLISGLTSVRNAEGMMKLARITEKIYSLLMITKLITIFDTYDSVDDALKSF